MGFNMDFPDLAEMIIRGALSRVGELYKLPPSQVNFYSSTNRLQLAMRVNQMLGSEKTSVKWPLLFAHSNTVTLGEQGTNSAFASKQLARHGIYVQLRDNGQAIGNLRLTPALFSLELTYMTDNFFNAFNFATQWVLHGIKNDFNFSITYAGANIDIRVEADNNVSTPDRDEAVSHPNVYEYTTNMNIWGYIGEPELRTVPILNKSVSSIVPALPNAVVTNSRNVTFPT